MTIYYLSTQGDDSNTGSTVEEPVKTFTRLTQLLQEGDTGYIESGVYDIPDNGKIKPINNTDVELDRKDKRIKLIGDINGDVFPEGGEVVYDGLENVSTTHIRPVDLTEWAGQLEMENIKFDRWSMPNGAYSGGVISNENNNSAIQLTLTNCQFTNIVATNTNNSGVIIQYDYRHPYSYLKAQGCYFEYVQSAHQYNTAFEFRSFESSQVASYSFGDHVVSFRACTFESNKKGNDAYRSWFCPNYSQTQYFDGLLNISIKNCEFTNEEDVGTYFIDYIEGTVNFTIEDTRLEAYRWYSNDANLPFLVSMTIRRSELFMEDNLLLAHYGQKNIIEDSFIQAATVSLYPTYGTNEVKRCVLTGHEDNALSLQARPNYGASIFEDCLFMNIEEINVDGTESHTLFNHCLFSNFVNTSSGQIRIGNMCFISECLFLKLNTYTLFDFGNDTSTNSNSITNSMFSRTLSYSGDSGYGITKLKNRESYLTVPLQFPPNFPLKGWLTPTTKDPLSGKRSAVIHCNGIGVGTLSVLLEGGKENTVNLHLKTDFSEGTYVVYIEDEEILRSTISELNNGKTVSIPYTPYKSGLYEVKIFFNDDTDPTVVETYGHRKMLIDSVSVS